jgi:hypothetical protein
VNPRSNNIDVRDDTGKADACHYELTAATRIPQYLVVILVAPIGVADPPLSPARDAPGANSTL